MPKKQHEAYFSNYTPVDVLALSIRTYNTQGFIRSGEGYTEYDDNGLPSRTINDNKTEVTHLMVVDTRPTDEELSQAKEIMDKFNGKFMLKKLTGGLTSFEQNVNRAFSEEITKFGISIIASIPHMNQVDKKRQTVTDRLESVRFESEYFGENRLRYDINVEVIDVKFIQSSGVYMITTLFNDRDIIKFWWRDQPDISDIIDGKTIKIRGTVNKHENSKYSKAKETMLNRVKIMEKY